MSAARGNQCTLTIRPLHPHQVSQRPDAAEILQRLQASTPGLAATSSRSLGSATSVPQSLVAADAVPSDPLQQPLCTDGSSSMAGSEFYTPAASTGHNPFAAQSDSQQPQP
jgi:hypothetical protein